MSGIVPVNPIAFMNQAFVEGIGTTAKPKDTDETKQAFVSMLLDQVFLKSFMRDDEDGIFATEDNTLFSSQDSTMYKELVRAEMIKKLSTDESFGFSELLAQVPTGQE